MSNQPLVSIVIPVYNGSNYLKQAIESALTQTYPRVEVLVINDGSTDDGLTEKIALCYREQIRYFYKPNGGVASALNLGLQQMQGEWSSWLSHDDVFPPERIANDMDVAFTYPEARVIFCRIQTIDSSGRITGTIRYPVERVTNPREALVLGGVNMCSMTIQRDCFEVTGPFNENNRTTQDTEMTLRLATAFPFYLNSHVGLFSREHRERGTYVLQAEHQQDMANLCNVIHDDLKIEAFFPNLSKFPSKQADAWVWMGSQYLSFGRRDYASESFRNALAASQTFIQKMRTSSVIVALWLAKTLLAVQIRSKFKMLFSSSARGE